MSGRAPFQAELSTIREQLGPHPMCFSSPATYPNPTCLQGGAGQSLLHCLTE